MGAYNPELSSSPLDPSDNSIPLLPSIDNMSAQQLPTTLFEALIPGYSLISSFFLHNLGIDITRIVTVAFFVFCAHTGARYCYDHMRDLFRTYYTSSISIDSYDEIYDQVMDWIKDQTVAKDARKLHASTGHRAWDDVSGVDDGEYGDMTDGKMLNFANWDLKVPPTFQPFFGTHRFQHNGRWFEFRREQRELLNGSYGGSGLVRDEEIISLTCIGRSTKPLKDLIRTCQNHSVGKKSFKTTVQRPAVKERRMHGRYPWTRVAKRPSRPMDTVVLDQDQKERVLKDINQYLHPATFPWYANRGIPYRRGYLFHGPPGTGKTSLSFAIAGIFGLDIYCISLLEPTLTEEDLSLLFNNLPRRCVVLLEDIDTAGLVNRDANDADQDAEKVVEDEKKKDHDSDKDTDSSTPEIIQSEPAEPSEAEVRLMTARVHAELLRALGSLQTTTANTARETARAAKKAKSKDSDDDKKKGISLSGLLNAIDGVASHEGRVLVMTTNHPEKLDEALIRPGRIDMKVAFTMASHDQIRKLFVRMYSDDAPQPNYVHAKLSAATPTEKAQQPHQAFAKLSNDEIQTLAVTNHLQQPRAEPTPPATPEYAAAIISLEKSSSSDNTDDLEKIAAQFAEKLPDGEFTPAEVQGFLLMHKREPKKALEEVVAWRDKLKEAKAAKSKIA